MHGSIYATDTKEGQYSVATVLHCAQQVEMYEAIKPKMGDIGVKCGEKYL